MLCCGGGGKIRIHNWAGRMFMLPMQCEDGSGNRISWPTSRGSQTCFNYFQASSQSVLSIDVWASNGGLRQYMILELSLINTDYEQKCSMLVLTLKIMQLTDILMWPFYSNIKNSWTFIDSEKKMLKCCLLLNSKFNRNRFIWQR